MRKNGEEEGAAPQPKNAPISLRMVMRRNRLTDHHRRAVHSKHPLPLNLTVNVQYPMYVQAGPADWPAGRQNHGALASEKAQKTTGPILVPATSRRAPPAPREGGRKVSVAAPEMLRLWSTS